MLSILDHYVARFRFLLFIFLFGFKSSSLLLLLLFVSLALELSLRLGEFVLHAVGDHGINVALALLPLLSKLLLPLKFSFLLGELLSRSLSFI